MVTFTRSAPALMNLPDRKGSMSNYAMQRSSRVGTPLAGTGTGADGLRSASGAPSARRR
jgi:hypothetical protein